MKQWRYVVYEPFDPPSTLDRINSVSRRTCRPLGFISRDPKSGAMDIILGAAGHKGVSGVRLKGRDDRLT